MSWRWLRWSLFAAGVALVLGVCVLAEIQEAAVRNHALSAQTYRPNEQPSNPIANLGGPKHSNEGDQKGHWYDHLTEWLLVLFNGILAIFTVRLFYNAAEQSLDTKASVAVAHQSATAAMIGARAAQKSADTAEKAFSYVERPYVFAFGVQRLEADTDRVGGFEPFVSYSVANYGKTPAVIENVRVGFCISESQPEGPTRVDDTNDLLVNPILGAGERRDGLIEIFPAGMERTQHRDEDGRAYAIPAMKSTEDLFFRIIIDYRGAFTEGHECGFCWRYDRSTAHFVQHGHKDYNYVA